MTLPRNPGRGQDWGSRPRADPPPGVRGPLAASAPGLVRRTQRVAVRLGGLLDEKEGREPGRTAPVTAAPGGVQGAVLARAPQPVTGSRWGKTGGRGGTHLGLHRVRPPTVRQSFPAPGADGPGRGLSQTRGGRQLAPSHSWDGRVAPTPPRAPRAQGSAGCEARGRRQVGAGRRALASLSASGTRRPRRSLCPCCHLRVSCRGLVLYARVGAFHHE